MTMYEIEKGIPVKEQGRGVRTSKYPVKDMEVGDSFFVPEKDATRIQLGSAITYCSLKYPERRFVLRKVKGGHRAWRIE